MSIGFQEGCRELLVTRLALHVVMLVLHDPRHGTAPYKHFGVVNQIKWYLMQASTSTTTGQDSLLWLPGFGRIAGFDSPLAYAAWSKLFVVNLVECFVIGVRIPRIPLDRQRAVACSFFLFAAGNWVAQDYLSPQAIGFVLSIGDYPPLAT